MRNTNKKAPSSRVALLIIFFFSCCINVLVLAFPLYTLQIFARVIPTGSLETLFYLSLMVGAVLLALLALELVRDRIVLRLGHWLDQAYSARVLDHHIAVRKKDLSAKSSATALARLRAAFASNAILPLFDLAWVPAYVFILFLLHPVLGLIASLTAGALFILSVLHAVLAHDGRSGLQASRAESDMWWDAAAPATNRLGALGLRQGTYVEWGLRHADSLHRRHKISKRSGTIRAAARFLRYGAQVLMYGSGAFLVVTGHVSPGVMIASAIILSRALVPLEQTVTTLRTAISGLRAMRELARMPASPSIVEAVDDYHRSGQLVLNNVSFVYPGRRTPSVRNISARLVAGECLGIIGPNGSGKSTLARLIAGEVEPSAGAVELDGLPVWQLQRTRTRAAVGWLEERATLLPGTVHENICGFSDQPLISAVDSAIRAGVHEILSDLPDGYLTKVSPDGEPLNGTEIRALALARAIHPKPPVLVLDQPDIGLDRGGEKRLLRTLDELKARGTSVIVITHRPFLLELTDKLMVLNEGGCEMFGNSSDVAQRLFPQAQAIAEA